MQPGCSTSASRLSSQKGLDEGLKADWRSMPQIPCQRHNMHLRRAKRCHDVLWLSVHFIFLHFAAMLRVFLVLLRTACISFLDLVPFATGNCFCHGAPTCTAKFTSQFQPQSALSASKECTRVASRATLLKHARHSRSGGLPQCWKGFDVCKDLGHSLDHESAEFPLTSSSLPIWIHVAHLFCWSLMGRNNVPWYLGAGPFVSFLTDVLQSP